MVCGTVLLKPQIISNVTVIFINEKRRPNDTSGIKTTSYSFFLWMKWCFLKGLHVTNNAYFVCYWRWFCNEIRHFLSTLLEPNVRTYAAPYDQMALFLELIWSYKGVGQDRYSKFAIVWSGRCPILENAVELTDLDHLWRTLERQQYSRYFDHPVVLLAREHPVVNMWTLIFTLNYVLFVYSDENYDQNWC